MTRCSTPALILLALVLGCGGSAPSAAQATSSGPTTQWARIPASQINSSRRTAITDAVARVSPSVVTVQTEVIERVAVDPFDALFSGDNGVRQSAGLGSGIIIRPDGLIVTNAHVIAGAQKISVALRDGTTYTAKVLGSDPTNDIAVIKVDAANLPVAPLGNSDSLLIGEWAIAIGNPYGFLLGNTEPSVTAGVVSAVGRNLVGRGEGNALYVDMIQTDASINPGNSGGPLVDALGQVIGINSSIYSPSGGSVGLGFAIPIDRVKRVVDDLVKHGQVRRPWLGIKPLLPSSTAARGALNGGVIVRTVVPGSPAARAGIQPGDMIVRAGTRALHNAFDWEAELLDLRVGDTVALGVKRGSRTFTVNVGVADLPEVNAPRVEVLKELSLVTLTPQIRADRGIRSSRGAVIVGISDQMSDQLGLQQGDVIVQINQTPVRTADDVAHALDYYGGRGPIRMYFEHAGQIYSTDFIIQ